MKSYKSLEAHNFFLSGWVHTVFHIHIKGTKNILMKADVCPSQRMNDDPHHPWIVIHQEGKVIAAHCDCKAEYVNN